MRDRWRALRGLWLAVLLAGLVWLLARHGDDLRAVVEEAEPGWLVLALATSVAQLALNAQFWADALARLGAPLPYPTVLAAGARSVLARYVPGGVWYQVGRVALLQRSGASRRALGTVAVLDTALGPAVALALGAGLLAATGRVPGGVAWLVPWAVGLFLLCSPPVVNRALAEVARRRPAAAGTAQLGWGSLLVLVGRTAAFLAVSTLTFLLYLRAFPALAPDLPSVAATAGAYLVALAAGFLALFAPQGAGVFEATVAALLTGEPLGRVALVAAGFRALVLLRDVGVTLVAAVTGVGPPARAASTRRP